MLPERLSQLLPNGAISFGFAANTCDAFGQSARGLFWALFDRVDVQRRGQSGGMPAKLRQPLPGDIRRGFRLGGHPSQQFHRAMCRGSGPRIEAGRAHYDHGLLSSEPRVLPALRVNSWCSSGVLMGQFLRKSLQTIYVDASDGFYARVFTKPQLRRLASPYFRDLRITMVGLKAELYPLPRTRFKLMLERFTPDWLASFVLKRVGSMVVIEATRSDPTETNRDRKS
jgi:hypothetical protein